MKETLLFSAFDLKNEKEDESRYHFLKKSRLDYLLDFGIVFTIFFFDFVLDFKERI